MEIESIMENKENKEKKLSKMKTSAEYSRIFRERLGNEEYNKYMRPYQTIYNAKEETKELRRKRNADYYQRKKEEKIAIPV
jgi:hypothetical protein